VFGLALSVASTVVLLRTLEGRGLLETDDGRIAVGWLVVEDLVMVIAIVLLPGFAGLSGDHQAGEVAAVAATTLGKVGLFVAIMLVVGSRFLPWLIRQVDKENSPELFTLATIALALGVAFGAAKIFGVSYALGAFVAGVVVNETDMSHRAARELRPLQDAFGALVFVAVGMLFDPRAITTHPWHLLAVVAVIVVGKSIAAAVIVRSLGRPLPTALMVAAALGQIGEFSFILGTLAVTYGFLGHDAFDLIVAGALVSIALNPVLFRLVGPVRQGTLGSRAVGSDGANR
jgi:CPA2 family monovalent cation:H+ antiporter-2